jgi:dTDP-4-dehydrorhamnose 3,5-epimerase
MKVTPLAPDGPFIIERTVRQDERGTFERLFCRQELRSVWGDREIKQINRSVTKQAGSVRGLHFQAPPHQEMKLVQCVRGSVIDYAVNLNKGSQNHLKVYSVELSAHRPMAFLLPEGFAHGFQTLEDGVELIYFHSEFYVPNQESGLSFFDPKLKIQLPLKVSEISERDQSFKWIE